MSGTALQYACWAGALFLIGFALLFGWQVGGFVTRNRHVRYDFDHLRSVLLLP